jgi:hypothetical protein
MFDQRFYIAASQILRYGQNLHLTFSGAGAKSDEFIASQVSIILALASPMRSGDTPVETFWSSSRKYSVSTLAWILKHFSAAMA